MGIGNGEWRMENWELGIGNWELGIGKKRQKSEGIRQRVPREADLFGLLLFGADVPKDAHYSLLITLEKLF
ncbi:MAG: hypothetical protein F6K47_26485 [Symploca sp. SIO2E6]|nr:hypothetical protein [Symploca sp. SIO2E6]